MSDKFRKNNISQSVFEKNYKELSEEKKELIIEKYTCSICLEIIKYENPYLCYECQKIFHHSCLKNWDARQKEQRKPLTCPNCRNKMPLNDWKVLLNYDENRAKDAEILNQIGKTFNPGEFTRKSINLFKLVLSKFNHIHPLIEPQKNYKLNNLLEELESNLVNPSIEEISTVINEEMDLLEEYILNIKKGNKKEDIIYKNEINLKYKTYEEGVHKIFGNEFVENHESDIALIINGKQSPLINEYYLKKGENNVTICIKKKLFDLSNMFSFCYTLNNIDELKYLNTEDVRNFSSMFYCCNIININALENWDVSKSENFSFFLGGCEYISNINALKNWNVSKCTNFSQMFYCCKNLSNIKALENWNVSNGSDFSNMFERCQKLDDIKPLEKWDVSKCTNFGYMFAECYKLFKVVPIKNWNVSNATCFKYMFFNDLNLFIKPLENWDISNARDLEGLFAGLVDLTDLTPVKNWNVSKCQNFSKLFYGCDQLSDLTPIKNWNVSKGNNFKRMFSKSVSLKNKDILKNWKYSNENYYKSFFE